MFFMYDKVNLLSVKNLKNYFSVLFLVPFETHSCGIPKLTMPKYVGLELLLTFYYFFLGHREKKHYNASKDQVFHLGHLFLNTF
jgi:hypothetical protein